MFLVEVMLGIVLILLDYYFPNLFVIFPGFAIFIVLTSKTTRATLIQTFIFFSTYFLFFSDISVLWGALYLIVTYLSKVLLEQISEFKFKLLLLLGLDFVLYIPLLINRDDLHLMWYGIIFWMIFTIVVYTHKEKVQNQRRKAKGGSKI